jgi:hypothetical protein
MNQKQANQKTGSAVAPSSLLRYVFREVLAGDTRKFKAQSNDATTGGGARDFRFRPYDKFGGIFEQMLSSRKTELRLRDGVRVPQELYTSRVRVVGQNGAYVDKPIEFEPPTTARPDEGRLTRLSSYGLEVPSGNGGRILLLLYQTGDSQLWLNFVTQQQLEAGLWDATLTKLLLNCLNAPRAQNHAAQGFHDFALGSDFCKSAGN